MRSGSRDGEAYPAPVLGRGPRGLVGRHQHPRQSSSGVIGRGARSAVSETIPRLLGECGRRAGRPQ
eukprot:3462041-Lingulodinium_polyedra.AAC.1